MLSRAVLIFLAVCITGCSFNFVNGADDHAEGATHGSDTKDQARKHIAKYIAQTLNQKTLNPASQSLCPEGFTPQMCQQPSTFYMWLRELRQKANQKEAERKTKEQITMLLGKIANKIYTNNASARVPPPPSPLSVKKLLKASSSMPKSLSTSKQVQRKRNGGSSLFDALEQMSSADGNIRVFG